MLREIRLYKLIRVVIYKLINSSFIILFFWPLVLLGINHNWIFLNAEGYIDSWIYFGYFIDLPMHLRIFAGTYYGSRLTWVLPGYLLYRLLPPLVANIALHLSVYYVVVLSTYGTLAISVHRRAALLASVILGSYSYFLLASGWDYIDGAGIAYFSLTTLLLTLSSKRVHRLQWLWLAGVTAAAMVYTNIFWIALTPCFGLYYLFINRHQPIKLVLLSLLPIAIGTIVLTVALGVINVVLGGEFFFYVPSLSFASYVYKLPSNPWIQSSTNWAISTPYLAWPALILVASSLWLIVPGLRAQLNKYSFARLFLAQYLLAALIMLAVQLFTTTPVLQNFAYASYLIPMSFLAFGALFSSSLINLSKSKFVVLMCITGTSALLSFALGTCGQFPVQYPVLLTLASGLIGLLLLMRWPNILWIYVACIAILYVVTPNAFKSTYGSNSFCRLAPKVQQHPEYQYLAVLDGIETIRKIAPEKRVYFWFNEREQPIYSALSSAYLYNWNQVSRDFPALSGGSISFLGLVPPPGTTIIVLSQTTTALDDAEATLRQHYRTFHLIAQKIIHRGGIEFTLFIGEIQAIPQKISANQVIDFTRVDYTDRFLGRGWSKPGEAGTWTEGPQAELDMIIDRSTHQDIEMTVDVASSIGAFVAHPPDMAVQVLVNGIRLDTWHITAQQPGGEFHVVIPDAVLSISDTTHIVFDINQPHTPKDLGINDDVRALGIIIRSIQFTDHNF